MNWESKNDLSLSISQVVQVVVALPFLFVVFVLSRFQRIPPLSPLMWRVTNTISDGGSWYRDGSLTRAKLHYYMNEYEH